MQILQRDKVFLSLIRGLSAHGLVLLLLKREAEAGQETTARYNRKGASDRVPSPFNYKE